MPLGGDMSDDQNANAPADAPMPRARRVFESLPRAARAALVLTAVRGRSIKELATALDAPQIVAGALVHRSRGLLRDALLADAVTHAPASCGPHCPRLGAFVAGGLAPRERRLLRAHIASCAHCSGAVTEATDLDQVIRAAAALGPVFHHDERHHDAGGDERDDVVAEATRDAPTVVEPITPPRARRRRRPVLVAVALGSAFALVALVAAVTGGDDDGSAVRAGGAARTPRGGDETDFEADFEAELGAGEGMTTIAGPPDVVLPAPGDQVPAPAGTATTLASPPTSGERPTTTAAVVPPPAPPGASADLGVIRTVEDPTLVSFRIVVTLRNAGPNAAAGPKLTAAKGDGPDGVILTATAPAGWTCGSPGAQVVCSASTIAAGDDATITIDVQVPLSSSGRIDLTATSSTRDPASANNTAAVVWPGA
jgi:Domain of unknown function DUF11/Putative zinc-finger